MIEKDIHHISVVEEDEIETLINEQFLNLHLIACSILNMRIIRGSHLISNSSRRLIILKQIFRIDILFYHLIFKHNFIRIILFILLILYSLRKTTTIRIEN